MERKICTFTEPTNERLQLVAMLDDSRNLTGFEIRCNRQIIYKFKASEGLHARLVFYHCVHEIMINRSKVMLNLT